MINTEGYNQCNAIRARQDATAGYVYLEVHINYTGSNNTYRVFITQQRFAYAVNNSRIDVLEEGIKVNDSDPDIPEIASRILIPYTAT